MAWIKEPGADGIRRYRAWAGCPQGIKEDTTRCICSVPDQGRSPLSNQCSRKRGHGPDGLYCKQHAKALAAAERAKRALDEAIKNQ